MPGKCLPRCQASAAFIEKFDWEEIAHLRVSKIAPSYSTNGPTLGDSAMQDRRPPLRLIRTPELEKSSGDSAASSKTGPAAHPEAPTRERVAGRSLIGFLSSFADSIDNDIKNIMDL